MGFEVEISFTTTDKAPKKIYFNYVFTSSDVAKNVGLIVKTWLNKKVYLCRRRNLHIMCVEEDYPNMVVNYTPNELGRCIEEASRRGMDRVEDRCREILSDVVEKILSLVLKESETHRLVLHALHNANLEDTLLEVYTTFKPCGKELEINCGEVVKLAREVVERLCREVGLDRFKALFSRCESDEHIVNMLDIEVTRELVSRAKKLSNNIKKLILTQKLVEWCYNNCEDSKQKLSELIQEIKILKSIKHEF